MLRHLGCPFAVIVVAFACLSLALLPSVRSRPHENGASVATFEADLKSGLHSLPSRRLLSYADGQDRRSSGKHGERTKGKGGHKERAQEKGKAKGKHEESMEGKGEHKERAQEEPEGSYPPHSPRPPLPPGCVHYDHDRKDRGHWEGGSEREGEDSGGGDGWKNESWRKEQQEGRKGEHSREQEEDHHGYIRCPPASPNPPGVSSSPPPWMFPSPPPAMAPTPGNALAPIPTNALAPMPMPTPTPMAAPAPAPAPASRAALAEEAIGELVNSGYTITAQFLRETGALLRITPGGGTLLAPNNNAYKWQNLDSSLKGKFGKLPTLTNIMLYHILGLYQEYKQLLQNGNASYPTLLDSAPVRGLVLGAEPILKFESISKPKQARVIDHDLFENELVVIQGIRQVLVPPPQYLDITTSPPLASRPPPVAPGPTGQPGLKRQASRVPSLSERIVTALRVGGYTTTANLLVKTGVPLSLLGIPGTKLTILAPSNHAWSHIPSHEARTLLATSQAANTSLMMFHTLFPGRFSIKKLLKRCPSSYSTLLLDSRKHETKVTAAAKVKTSEKDGVLFFQATLGLSKSAKSRVMVPDFFTEKGEVGVSVHVVDKVLLPKLSLLSQGLN